MNKQQIEYLGTPKIRKYEPEGIEIFGTGLPKDYISKPTFLNRIKSKRSSILKDDQFFCVYALIIMLFLMIILMSVVFTKQISFVQDNLNEHLIKDTVKNTIPTISYSPVSDIESKPLANRGNISKSLSIPPEAGTFKSYMDYRTITDKSSDQWALQKLAITDTQGFRTIKSMYMVALGTFYTDRIGQTYIITLESGKSFKAIVGDLKRDEHCVNRQYTKTVEHNLVEFIIDDRVMDQNVLISGDISVLGFQGKIISIVEAAR